MARFTSSPLDMLGAAPDRVITVRVRDPLGLAASKGGTAGSIASALVPETITAKVYNDMAVKLGDGLRNEGIDAEVKVVDATALVPVSQLPTARGSDLVRGMVVGGVLVVLGKLAYNHLIKRIFGIGS